MRGDVKKLKSIHKKDPKTGNVKKVNFGFYEQVPRRKAKRL